MPLEVESDKVVCSRCGKEYAKRRGNFKVSYAACHKGIGFMSVCSDCVDAMYMTYLSQCKNTKDAVRQMCRKLDIFWSEAVFDTIEKKSTARNVISKYIQRINTNTYAGKSYDDTLANEGTLWTFASGKPDSAFDIFQSTDAGDKDPIDTIDTDVILFWGTGYSAEMYEELEKRKAYWLAGLPDNLVDIRTDAFLRQICPLEIDINKNRAEGKDVDKLVAQWDKLVGSAGFKPGQNKQDDLDTSLANTPLGVWLYRYENKRPLPEIDEDLKDVNGIKKYVFTWMGHLCKMLGLKNAYSKLYEDEIAKYSVSKPEYDGDDNELIFDDPPIDECTGGDQDE